MNRYAIPLFFVLLSVGIFIEYVDPTIASIQANRAMSTEYTKYIQAAGEAESQLLALKQKQEKFPAGYDQALATILPPSVDPTRLIIDVDGIAQLRGLTIKSPSAKISEGTGLYLKHSLTFGVSAPYSIFRSFLRDLESSLALRDATAVSFTSSTLIDETVGVKSPELKPLDYTITIITYSRGS